eukprot:3256248-Alexandrium_andersonii.AAC.1
MASPRRRADSTSRGSGGSMGWRMPLPKPPEEASRRAWSAQRTAESPSQRRLRVCQRRQSGRVHVSMSVQ